MRYTEVSGAISMTALAIDCVDFSLFGGPQTGSVSREGEALRTGRDTALNAHRGSIIMTALNQRLSDYVRTADVPRTRAASSDGSLQDLAAQLRETGFAAKVVEAPTLHILGGRSCDNDRGIRIYNEPFMVRHHNDKFVVSVEGCGQRVSEWQADSVEAAVTHVRRHYAL